ncbi:MAG: phenylacetate--CoA ligase [Gammaproteobacteria bacterium]|nr:phenylacetate--CoA ligase [Gammaproteobacteria bacterium]
MKLLWNEEIETLSAGALTRLESERLQEQLPYNFASSSFYRARFEAAGVKPEEIRSREDLPRLPFMEKSELASSQLDGSLIGVNQCAALEDIVRVQATGGTTGRPMRIALTRRDIADYNEMGARALWAAGCRPGDIVFECMNYNLYAGGLSDHMAFETLGAATIPFGVGNTRNLLEMMTQIDQDVAMWSTPSYAVRLAEVAAQMEINPRDVGLRKGFFSGEAGMQVAGYRERIEDTWGLRSGDLYGAGELGMHCGECEQRDGVHYGATGFVLTELINPETTEPVPFTDGASGEFVYTSIRRQASPLMRMRSHDLMQVFTEACACGRSTFRFRILGRSDDMFIVKGVNVFPLAVQATITGSQPRLTGEFQIILDRPLPIDYAPRILVEVARDVPKHGHAEIIAETEAAIAKNHNFTCAIELVEQGTIATEKKTRRLIRAYLEES